MIKEAIKQYQLSHGFDHFDPKCVLFDMDGVLYDSMRNHAAAWQEAMAQFDIHFTAADSYATEGARGVDTIRHFVRQQQGREIDEAEAQRMYDVKADLFQRMPTAEIFPGVLDIMQKIQSSGLTIGVVTGSGQRPLIKTYDGKAVNGPVVKAGDKVLAEGTDYTLTYKDSEGNELSETPVNAGTYTVTVNGLGTYAGMNLNVTFTISPKAAELTVVADPSSAKYDGKSKTPEVTVKDGDKVLKEGTDYTLSYVYGEDAETKDFAGAEFVKEGNYTITVTGIGNYEGSTGKAVFTISKNNSASTDPTNPSNPNGDKNVTDKKVSNNTNNVKPVVKNVAAKNNKNVPKTGDNANVLLWIALAVISCGVLAGAGVAVRKRK